MDWGGGPGSEDKVEKRVIGRDGKPLGVVDGTGVGRQLRSPYFFFVLDGYRQVLKLVS